MARVIKLLVKLLCWSCLLTILMLPLTVKAATKTFIIENDDTEKCLSDHRYLYLPTSISPGTYYCRLCPTYINSARSLIIKPYRVWVKYEYHLNKRDPDGVNSDPYLSISRVDPGGNIIPDTTTKIMINYGKTYTNYVAVNPNEGLLFDYYTGEWYWRQWWGGHENRSYTGYVEVTYQFDETPPNTPKAPRASGGTVLGDICYTKYNENMQVVLEWDAVSDQGTSLGGYSTVSGIKHYNIYSSEGILILAGVKPISGQNTVSVQLDGSLFPVGQECGIKIQAVDNENNASDFSPVTKIVVDSTPPSSPTNITTPNINGFTNAENIIWTWDQATDDCSGIKEYQVYIEKDGMPVVNWVSIGLNTRYQYFVSKEGTYSFQIKTIDKAGNSSISPVKTIKVDRSVETIILPKYCSRLNGKEVIFQWNPVTDFSGIKKYQVALSKSPSETITSEEPVYTNNLSDSFDGLRQVYEKSFPEVQLFDIPIEINWEFSAELPYLCFLTENPWFKILIYKADGSVEEVLLANGCGNKNGNYVLPSNSYITIRAYSGEAKQFITFRNKGCDCQYNVSYSVNGEPKKLIMPAEHEIIKDIDSPTNNKWESVLPISSIDNTYYLWVRGIDNVGNIGAWTRTGPFPSFKVIGPKNESFIKDLTQTFKVEAREPDNSEEFKYQLCYQRYGIDDITRSPIQTTPIEVTFPSVEGQWKWWMEIFEGESEVAHITDKYTFSIDQTGPTGSITVKTEDGGRVCTETEPANQRRVILTDLQLSDPSGVKGVRLWNGTETTPPTEAIYFAFDEIPTAGIPWELPELDGVHQINMLVEDLAGNTTLVTSRVALDRIAPGAPHKIIHSYTNGIMTFKWTPGEPSADISRYRGTYILPDGTEQPFSVTPAETKEGQYQINVGLGANQPVIIKICSVDRAGNESAMAEHIGCTPAEPGRLQFLGTGYDTAGNRHYLTWKLAEPGIAETHILEYGKVTEGVFEPIIEIEPDANGIFTHNSTGPNPEDKLQPHAAYQYRLAAYNKAGDRSYSQDFAQAVENLPPVKPEITQLAPAGYASAKVIFDYPEVKDYDNDAVTYTVKWAAGADPAPGAYQSAIWDPELGKYTIDLDPGKHGTTYSWRLEVKDSYGAVTTSDAVKFVLDANNPAITLEKPKSLYTNLKELQVSVKDDLSGIKTLEYKIGNEKPRTVQLTSGTGGAMMGTIPLPEGQYNLKVTVQDQAGNSVSEDVNNLRVDHTLPTLDTGSIVINLGTKDGVYLTSGKIPISWKANDNGSGIAGIRYWVLGNGEAPGPGTCLALSSGLTEYAHNLEIPTAKSNGQTYTLQLAVVDKAGNSSAPYRLPQAFLLDTTPPEASLALTGLYPYGSSLYLTNLENLQAILNIAEEESGATASFNLIESVNGTPITTWDNWENVKQTILTPGTKYRVAARVSNGVGLETEVLSEEFTFDNSEPIIANLTGPEQPLASGENFILNVTAAEYESGIVKYRIAIGAAPGGTEFTALMPGSQNGWFEINTNSLQPHLRMETPAIADGAYHITLEAVNAAGLTARFNEDRVLTVNNHQERIVVSDQGPYTMFADRLTGWWKYNGTKPVSSYRFRILDQDNRVVRDWETTTEKMITVTQLQLENGKTYRFEVQAVFQENLLSGSGFSPGVTVDTTIPTITELKAPLYAAPNNFGFEWAGSDDCSGISRVLAAVGAGYNQTDVTKGWVEVTGNSVKLSRDANGEPLVFDLNNTNRYYLTLRLVNGSGLTAEKAAPAIVVDNTPPPTPVVYDQGAFINTKPEQPLEAHWFWSEADPESGCSYQWTILKYGEKVNSLTEWHDGDDTKRISLTMDEFRREHGETYYFAVKATNGAGLSSIGYSDGIMADATAPYLVKVKVLDATNQSGDDEINYVTDANKELRLWIDSYDPQSDVAYYLYAWNVADKVDNTERLTSTTEPISIANPNLAEGAVNVFLGETVNRADITSPPGYSTGIVVDGGAPVIKNVRGFVSGNSLLFDWDVETSASPVVRYEYAFVKEANLNSIAPGDWKTAEDKSLDRRLTLDATAYQDGRYCLVVRGYNAAGTYSRHDAEHQEWGISNVITLDRTAPEITTAVFPKYADELLKISVSGMDQGSGIGGYQYALGTAANPFQFSGGWIDLNNQASTVNIEIPTGDSIIPHNSGVYAMVRVKDKVGLWSDAKVSGKIVIDHTKPETPALTYGRYTTNKLLLTGIQYQAADPESGLVNYRLGITTEIGGAWLVTKEEQIQLTPEGKPAQLNLAIAAPGLTEGGTYQLVLQVQNGAGAWSEMGYSGLITVDSIQPALTFTRAGQILVINEPPLNVEYTLSEDAQVKFTVTGADGTAKEETVSGVKGINQYIFKEVKPQLYTVTALPADKAGNVGAATEATKQTVRVNAPPAVSLAGEIKATLGRPLTLKADVTDPDGSEGDSFAYEWLPGDGGAALSGATPEYRYTALGEYILTLTVTDKDGGKTTVTSIVKVGNTTSGALSMDETWSGSHRIYGDVIVPAGIKLTIQPGTEIVIDGIPGATGYNHALIVRGSLNAGTGTGFTSVTGMPGGWQGILVEGAATLEGVAIRHAERGVAALDGSGVSLNNCIFENNLAGVHAYNSNPAISSCIFRNNVYGIKEDEGGRPVVKDCRFAENGVDYYHRDLTEISMEQLNGMPGNEGNTKE